MAPLKSSTELRIQTDTDRGDSDTNPTGDHNGISANSARIGIQPSLFHKIKNQKSILALAVSDSHIYAGTQGGDLLVRELSLQIGLLKLADADQGVVVRNI
jgi:di- and tripeptidase